MRLAYADPPYPGKADRYAENSEVDHVELVARLREYDGWALSTDEKNLRYVIGLCPEGTRTLAWCRPNVAPFPPYPFAAWEPVLCWPARPRHDSVRSYAEITTVGGHMSRENYRGQKPRGFCEWVLRCLGAVPGDTLDDLFPGSGVRVMWTWEPVIVRMPHWRQRHRHDFVRDSLVASQPHGFLGNEITGQKPVAFCHWIFDLLGCGPDDELVDIFPGSGAVGRAFDAWRAQLTIFTPVAAAGPEVDE